MDLNDMLKEHQLWLDKAHRALTAANAGDHAPADLKAPRIEQLKARIAELKGQKEREIRRYDVAIAELNDALAGLTAKPPNPDGSPAVAATKKKPAKEAKK